MARFSNKKKNFLSLIAFLQALGVALYCSLIGLIFWRGSGWFGPVPDYWGPLLFLLLFCTSALICAFFALGYPVWLFFREKKVGQALRLLLYTTLWLLFFTLLVILIVLL